MGDLVSMSEARTVRQRRKQAEMFNPAPFLEMQAAWLEMMAANVRMVMAVYANAMRREN
jgi:hypothetical protein